VPLVREADALLVAGGDVLYLCHWMREWRPPSGDETTLGVVDFSICPHLAADGMPGNAMTEAKQWAAGISNTAYAIDDQTAITVVAGHVDFVSEGHWEQLQTMSSEPDEEAPPGRP